MLGKALPEGNIDYVEINDEVGKKRWYFDFSFLMSNWNCLFGNGCVGIHSSDSPTYTQDGGCCTLGCWFTEPDDLIKTKEMVTKLTDDDWDTELRKHADKKGWLRQLGKDTIEDGEVIGVNAKTRVHEGVCIFNNRIGGSTGKPGCAFHALANRLEVSHVETKPNVCWQLPLRVEDDGETVNVMRWDRHAWSGIGEEGEQSWLNWWCVDSPEAYTGTKPVYAYMSEELKGICGDHVYGLLLEELEKRKDNYVSPMPGSQYNEGRTLLPLIVENKTPVR
jgi:hypothetical protein